MKNDKINRCEYIDLLRGFCVVVMIMGHVYFGNSFNKIIHSFHMPIWFVISGFFYNPEKDLKLLLLRKLKNLLIPYVTFGLIYETIWSFFGTNQWIGLLFPTSIQVPLNGALWFLPALFFAEIVSFILLKSLPKYLSVITISLVFAFGLYVDVELPLALTPAMAGMGFYLTGVLIKEHESALLTLKPLPSLILMALGVLIALFNGNVNLRTHEYGNSILFVLSSVMLCVAFFNIFRYLFRDKRIDFLSEIGRNSLIYVCTNQWFIFAINRISFDNMVLETIWRCIIVLIVTFLGFVLCRLLSKSKLKMLIGK